MPTLCSRARVARQPWLIPSITFFVCSLGHCECPQARLKEPISRDVQTAHPNWLSCERQLNDPTFNSSQVTKRDSYAC